MRAWESYKDGESYQNTKKWAAFADHVDGSLWVAFEAGWRLAAAHPPAPDHPLLPCGHCKSTCDDSYGGCVLCTLSKTVQSYESAPAPDLDADAHRLGDRIKDLLGTDGPLNISGREVVRETKERRLAAYRDGWAEGRKHGRAEMRKMIKRRLRALAKQYRRPSTVDYYEALARQVTRLSREERP